MRVHLGSDHAGLELKEHLLGWLRDNGHEPVDHGPFVYDAVDDYPVFCLRAAEGVAADPGSLGVVIGGSGNGEQIAANKVPGARCALGWSVETATLARQHNDAQLIGIGGRMHTAAEALAMADCPAALRKPLEQAVRAAAQRLHQTAQADGYRVPMAPEDYIWGSTMVLMNHAALLLLAADHFGRPEYAQTALDSVHWLLGRNPLSQCFVTGFGRRPILWPHYRPAEADLVEAPVPGLVSGGPNRNRQDRAMQQLLPPETPPARMFVDDSASFASNEVAIYWNTAAIFVVAHFL